jgi:NAD+ synthase
MDGTTADPLGRLAEWKAATDATRARLVEEVRATARTRGVSRIILGLSGGLDSSTAAALCTQAVGAENVLGILMPHRMTSQSSLAMAQGVVNALGITSRRVNMSPLIDAYFANFPDASRVRRGVGAAWMRNGVVVDLGHHYTAIVVQSVNRTDRLLRYGDGLLEMQAALQPLGTLFKSQVRMLAESLGVLPEVRSRRPSLEYWAGQSDDSDLGQTYEELDPILEELAEERSTPEQLRARAVSPETIDWVVETLRTGVSLAAVAPTRMTL